MNALQSNLLSTHPRKYKRFFVSLSAIKLIEYTVEHRTLIADKGKESHTGAQLHRIDRIEYSNSISAIKSEKCIAYLYETGR